MRTSSAASSRPRVHAVRQDLTPFLLPAAAGVAGLMNPETELDRHLGELLIQAAGASEADQKTRAASLVADVLALDAGRPRSYFLAGLASELLGSSFRAAPDEESSRWELCGKIEGLLRQGKVERARELAALPELEPFLSGGDSALKLLAKLARACREAGDLPGALDYADRALALGADVEVQALAMDLAAGCLSRVDALLKDGKLEEVRGLLEGIARREGLLQKLGYLAVRTFRKLGQCEQKAGDWEEAIARFREGLQRGPTDSQRAVLWCDIGLCCLGLSSINALAKGQKRDRRAEAKSAFERAVEAGEGFSINGAYALGVLAAEESEPEKAAEFFEMAHRSLKTMKMRSRSRIEPRIRAYLAEALLLGRGARLALPKALALLDQAAQAQGASLAERFATYRLLKTVDEPAAKSYLSKLDLSHVKHAAEGLALGGELLEASEPAKALEVSGALLSLFLKKQDRRDALTLKLRAENAVADARAGLATYNELKQLCLDQEYYAALETVLLEDGSCGEVLDAQERRKERLELYGLMPGRRIDRAALMVELARNYVNAGDEEGLRTAKTLLEEAGLHSGDIPALELEHLTERLEFEAQRLGFDLAGSGDCTLAHRMRVRFQAPPRILVVGGNEKQMADHESFVRLGQDFNFVGEWIPANYVNPDKTLALVRGRLQQGLKGLILLHYNRTEFGRSARKLAGEHSVVLRNLHLYGFKSLRTCVLEVLEKMLKMADERAAASGGPRAAK